MYSHARRERVRINDQVRYYTIGRERHIPLVIHHAARALLGCERRKLVAHLWNAYLAQLNLDTFAPISHVEHQLVVKVALFVRLYGQRAAHALGPGLVKAHLANDYNAGSYKHTAGQRRVENAIVTQVVVHQTGATLVYWHTHNPLKLTAFHMLFALAQRLVRGRHEHAPLHRRSVENYTVLLVIPIES
ncbi:hypothetical protein ORF036L [Spotted knifejaw iridovirus]|nr:hypothetical protein ORF036L [Spotted knifejaw iridovirus]